ncbi:NAD(P)-dependent oxidoreductase, partial [Methylopila musalis]
MTRVAVLGTGLMGAPMARRLLAAGFAVTAWNRTRAKADALVPDGAVVADSPREAARDADVILTMLENGDAVGEVLFGPDGAAEGLAPGAVVLDMSSIPPSTAREHAAALSRLGVAHVDAPVSGGTRGAAAGTLAIMAGGSDETIAALA